MVGTAWGYGSKAEEFSRATRRSYPSMAKRIPRTQLFHQRVAYPPQQRERSLFQAQRWTMENLSDEFGVLGTASIRIRCRGRDATTLRPAQIFGGRLPAFNQTL